MPPSLHSRKSGQAMIFLMVVVVVGLLIVVFNFDLHRVINAKIRVRNAADSAALAAARWQGHTLNMIGDLNLVQAAIISVAYEEYLEAYREWVANGGVLSGEPEPVLSDFLDFEECRILHELRARLEFIGPLTAFSVAQQTAFNNGAIHDPELALHLSEQAEYIRYQVEAPPYDNAFKEYADLLDVIVENGVAVGAYSLPLPDHPLVQEKFYSAIAMALNGWWCPFNRYRYHLENYQGFDSWGKLDTEFRYSYMLDLKLNAMVIVPPSGVLLKPPLAIPDATNYLAYLQEHLEEVDVILDHGVPDLVVDGMYAATNIAWHVYGSDWAKQWPRAAYYNDETGELDGRFPFHSNIKAEFDYMGAQAGFGVSARVHKGILASSTDETLELSYKTKAKPFGFLDTRGALEVPYYYGFVLPAFQEVRLVHSDIGDKVLDAAFHRHVTQHLEPYMEMGTAACQPDCRYCTLLVKWEGLDRQAGLKWLDEAYDDPDNNPCEPDDDNADQAWGKAGGGATGGS